MENNGKGVSYVCLEDSVKKLRNMHTANRSDWRPRETYGDSNFKLLHCSTRKM